MDLTLMFVLNSALLGVGLAMDAFSVSLANGLSEPNMHKSRMSLVAGTFAFYQFAMPLIGWLCVHTIAERFEAFQKFIPWIALALLGYIGGKMLIEGIRGESSDAEGNVSAESVSASVVSSEVAKLTFGTLMIQGIATSIDALSVGFTIANYRAGMAFLCALIVAIVTFVICMVGLRLGKKAGKHLSGRASILGGVILIGIGLEIFIKAFI